MTLNYAKEIIREVDGFSYKYLKSWGLSTIREAIRTIYERKFSTEEDRQIAEYVERKILRKY